MEGAYLCFDFMESADSVAHYFRNLVRSTFLHVASRQFPLLPHSLPFNIQARKISKRAGERNRQARFLQLREKEMSMRNCCPSVCLSVCLSDCLSVCVYRNLLQNMLPCRERSEGEEGSAFFFYCVRWCACGCECL